MLSSCRRDLYAALLPRLIDTLEINGCDGALLLRLTVALSRWSPKGSRKALFGISPQHPPERSRVAGIIAEARL